MATPSVWLIEGEPAYQAWLADVQDRHLAHDNKYRRTGGSVVGRTLVLAEDREQHLHVGVRLNTGDEFWQAWPGTFAELLQTIVKDGARLGVNGWYKTIERFPQWERDHGPAKRLEFCSSHVGGVVLAIMADGEHLVLDES